MSYDEIALEIFKVAGKAGCLDDFSPEYLTETYLNILRDLKEDGKSPKAISELKV